ncbi:M6 family metalloprotease domain-containing protein [Streptomyces yangpuensis]|uniref:M6 family metalloprotease domain-containing protein n=1 Tax=Streptomyces yangpuensis TaxID=1648182 RepID=UPI00371387CB
MARHRRTQRMAGVALTSALIVGGGLYLGFGSENASAVAPEAATSPGRQSPTTEAPLAVESPRGENDAPAATEAPEDPDTGNADDAVAPQDPEAGRATAASAACKLPATGANLSEGFGSKAGFTPSVGNVKTTMIFVDFPDAPADDSPAALHDRLVPESTQWFRTASFGRLNLTVNADTSRFHRMPRSSDSYGYQRGLSAAAHQQYIEDAVRAVGRSVDFRGTKALYIVPTKRASAISFSPTFMGSVTATDGTTIPKTVTFGQDMHSWGAKVLNHETGHAMGLPDLYSYASGGSGHPFAGGWDVMGLISGPSPDMTAWHKWKQHWIGDEQVDCVDGPGTSTATLTPVEKPGGKKMTVVKTGPTRAVVAETRSKQGNNAGACATGVLIYTIDTATESGSGPIRIQDARPGSGGCGGNELNDATFGFGPGAVSTFRDAESGTTIEVTGKNGDDYTLTVRK